MSLKPSKNQQLAQTLLKCHVITCKTNIGATGVSRRGYRVQISTASLVIIVCYLKKSLKYEHGIDFDSVHVMQNFNACI